MRAAIYARVSTDTQTTQNQLLELRDYCERRGWAVTKEYVDDGYTGSAASRPALDDLILDAKRGRFDLVVVWKLDRISRSLRNLLLLLDDFQHAGISFASVSEGIDLTTPGGRFFAHLLGALSEYEKQIIVQRVRLGLQRARKEGKRLGRPCAAVSEADLAAVAHLSLREAAIRLKVSKSAVAKWRRSGRAA